jgi:hypothetical protein
MSKERYANVSPRFLPVFFRVSPIASLGETQQADRDT